MSTARYEVARHRDVKRAARLMDKRRRGWWRRIAFKRLDMSSPCNCIAGQAGLDWADLRDEFATQYPDTPTAPFAEHKTAPFWQIEVAARRKAAKS